MWSGNFLIYVCTIIQTGTRLACESHFFRFEKLLRHLQATSTLDLRKFGALSTVGVSHIPARKQDFMSFPFQQKAALYCLLLLSQPEQFLLTLETQLRLFLRQTALHCERQDVLAATLFCMNWTSWTALLKGSEVRLESGDIDDRNILLRG